MDKVRIAKVCVFYKAGHHSKSRWKKGVLYCPACGKQGVWEEQDPGDYYVGSDYACTKCGAIFVLPNHVETMAEKKYPNETDLQIIEQLTAQDV
jgi:predicted RNA-binding Zn-ribbon protein involved in translation (DUF1610 family)